MKHAVINALLIGFVAPAVRAAPDAPVVNVSDDFPVNRDESIRTYAQY